MFFLYISLPSLHDYGGRKQATTKFSSSLRTWIWLLGIRLQEGSLAFDELSELE